MAKGFTMNFTTSTVTITKAFAEQAMIPNTDESKILENLRKICPDLHIKRKQINRKSINKGMTYRKIENYIKLFDNSEELLAAFEKVRLLSACQKNSYEYVMRWFHAQFPNFEDIPELIDGRLYIELVPMNQFVTKENNNEYAGAACNLPEVA